MPEESGVALARVDTRASGVPTRDDLAAINGRIALVPQAADSIFVAAFGISTDLLDSYGTRMHLSTLERFADGANRGRGHPYLLAHSQESLPVGRVFAGEVREMTPEELAEDSRAVPTWLLRQFGVDREEPLFAYQLREKSDVRHRKLVERAFLTRGGVTVHFADSVDHDSIIREIEAGNYADHSVGFSISPAVAPGAKIICDICGADYLDPDACAHFLLYPYEVEASGQRGEDPEMVTVIATATVYLAAQVEASLVYAGATPGALLERIVAGYREGRLGEKDVRAYEECWGQRILPRTVHTLPDGYIRVGDHIIRTFTADSLSGADYEGASAPREHEEEISMSNEIRELLGPERAERLHLYDRGSGDAASAIALLLDEVREADEAAAEEVRQRKALEEVVREELELQDGESIVDGLRRVQALGELGRTMKERLITEAVEARVRAQGPEFDSEKWKADLALLGPQRIQEIADEYRKAAPFVPGRVSRPAGSEKSPSTQAARRRVLAQSA